MYDPVLAAHRNLFISLGTYSSVFRFSLCCTVSSHFPARLPESTHLSHISHPPAQWLGSNFADRNRVTCCFVHCKRKSKKFGGGSVGGEHGSDVPFPLCLGDDWLLGCTYSPCSFEREGMPRWQWTIWFLLQPHPNYIPARCRLHVCGSDR